MASVFWGLSYFGMNCNLRISVYTGVHLSVPCK